MTGERTCVACRRRAGKAELVRYVAVAQVLTADPLGTAPGRGAYTCPSAACFDRAVARRSFTRALRATVTVPTDLRATLAGRLG